MGKLIKPVENQEGRWYVKFVNLGETFLSVGRHGVHELAYVDVAPLNKLKEKKDLVEPGKDEDDTSVCRSPPSPAPASRGVGGRSSLAFGARHAGSVALSRALVLSPAFSV